MVRDDSLIKISIKAVNNGAISFRLATDRQMAKQTIVSWTMLGAKDT